MSELKCPCGGEVVVDKIIADDTWCCWRCKKCGALGEDFHSDTEALASFEPFRKATEAVEQLAAANARIEQLRASELALVEKLVETGQRAERLEALVKKLWMMAGRPERVTITTASADATISVSIGAAADLQGGGDV